MPKRHSFKEAFTLIEVMVAVLIISIVIAALLQMQGDTHQKFFQIKQMMHTNQYNSFLLSQGEAYGFEDSKMDMKRLVENFDLESDLRRRLGAIKVELLYEEITTIDTSEFEDGGAETDENGEEVEQQETTTGIVFEIGKSIIKTEDFTGHLIRVRVQ